MQELLTDYLPGLRSFLIHMRKLPPELADDLLQTFVSDKLLAGRLVRKVDSARGGFRNYLLKSLNNFVSTRLERLRKSRELELGDDVMKSLAAPVDQDSFDKEWTLLVVHDALGEMQRDCESRDRLDIWNVLRLRVIDPMLHGRKATDYQEIVRQFELATPRQAMLLLVTAKRCFLRHLRAAVARYVAGEERVDEEIEDLREIVSR